MPPLAGFGPQKKTQFPTQPQPNPNNQKPQQPMSSIDTQQYPTYVLNVADIHLRSSTTLLAPKLLLITEILDTPIASESVTSQPQVVEPTNVTSLAQTQTIVEPPFPEKLIQSKPFQTEE